LSSIIKKLQVFNELVMFKHTVFSLPFIFIAMVVGAKGWFGFSLFGLGVFATITARNFAMAFNRYVDRNFDKQNPRTQNRPSVDGRVSSNSMIIFISINGLLFVVVSYFINPLAFKLSVPFLFILGLYSLIKRFSSLAHLFLGLALGLAPIAGAIATIGATPLWVYYLSVGVMFWVGGFDLLYALQDLEFDKKAKLHSIPAKYGKKKSLYISRIFHVVTVCSWFLFVQEADLGFFGVVGVVLSALMLFYEQLLVHKSLNNINKAFFTINGYFGFVFLLFIVLEFV
jgi:4-hydroxybenzoate polyprenyltransferase